MNLKDDKKTLDSKLGLYPNYEANLINNQQLFKTEKQLSNIQNTV
jgi:hypothetical protein